MATATATAPAEPAAATKGKGKSKLIIIVLVVLLLGAAGYVFFGPSKPAPTAEEVAAAEAEAEAAAAIAELGTVVSVDPISINLADGHFLKIGIALQQSASAHEDVDGSKALDAVIELYSGKSMEEISSPEGREHTKEELVEEVKHAYHDEVLDVYFTQYVMQ